MTYYDETMCYLLISVTPYYLSWWIPRYNSLAVQVNYPTHGKPHGLQGRLTFKYSTAELDLTNITIYYFEGTSNFGRNILEVKIFPHI